MRNPRCKASRATEYAKILQADRNAKNLEDTRKFQPISIYYHPVGARNDRNQMNCPNATPYPIIADGSKFVKKPCGLQVERVPREKRKATRTRKGARRPGVDKAQGDLESATTRLSLSSLNVQTQANYAVQNLDR